MASGGSLRLRLLRSMLLMIVPVLVFCLIFGQISTQNLSMYIEQQFLNIGSQTASQISMFFMKLRSAASLDLSDLFAAERSPRDEGAFAAALAWGENVLHEKKVSAYLYLRGDEHVYTSAGRIHYTGFTAELGAGYDFEMSSFFTSLNSCMTDRILSISAHMDSGPGLTAYLSPVYVDAKPVAVIFFLIPYETLDAILQDCLGAQQCNFHILDSRLNVILSRTRDSTLAYDDALLCQQQGVGIIRPSAGKQSLVAVRSLDPDNGLTYLCVYRQSVFFAELLDSRNSLWLLSAGLLAIVVVLGLLIVHWNYMPIRKTFDSLFDAMPDGRRTNELAYLQLRWAQSRETQQALARQVDEQRQVSREQLASRLMYGKIASCEEYQYLLRCAGARFDRSRFFAMYASLGARDDDMVPDIARHYAPEGAETISTTPLHAAGICYLINFDPAGGQAVEAALSAYAQSLCIWLADRGLGGAQVGVGSAYPDAMQLNLSYHEAAVALRVGSAPPRGQYTLYEPSLANSLDAGNLSSAPEKYLLLEGIDNADVAVAQTALDAIAERLGSGMDSYLQFQFSAYDLCRAMIDLMGRFGLSRFNERLMKLPMCESFPAFRETMRPLVAELCDAIRQKRQASDIQLRSDLLHYVHEHCMQADFSQELVTRALGISRARINAVFIEDMGAGFSQYVAGLRLAAFKRQLIETDRQVKDIVHDIGYLDVSNFLRKFKAITGMTAGQYRSIHRDRSDAHSQDMNKGDQKA